MVRFCYTFKYNPKLNFFGKIYAAVFGKPFIALYLRSLYFIDFLNKNNKNRKKFSKILDAGCGEGDFSFYLAKRFPKAGIDACDLYRKDIEANRKIARNLKIKNINFFVKNLKSIKGKEKYDLILLMNLLSFNENDDKILSNLHSALKKKGILLITDSHISDKVKIKKTESPHDYRVRKGYSEKKLKKMLEKAEFEVEIRRFCSGFSYIAHYLDNRIFSFNYFVRGFFAPFLKIFAFVGQKFESRNKGIYVLAIAKKKK
ncbi:MAG TPA: class I SAM-dependent methyltransferase [Candidatus Nanoarchaeia archaeon]|nr:class I SAM-dependent methyltransferase [Candidatus Nanoarchaeia archaeon]